MDKFDKKFLLDVDAKLNCIIKLVSTLLLAMDKVSDFKYHDQIVESMSSTIRVLNKEEEN